MGRRLIKEGVSSVVFHFCPLQAMYSIALEDKIKLSTSDRASDKRMSMGYPYFLSLSRTPSSAVGYQRMRINGTMGEWLRALVRIELDGDLLNNNFKGAPQNYFTDINDPKIKHDSIVYSIDKDSQNIVKKEMPRLARNVDIDDNGKFKMPRGRHTHPYGYTNYGIIDRNQMHEYEDRIVSNVPEIKNAGLYIKRIDILLKRRLKDNDSSKYVLSQIGEIIKRYGDKVHIYVNEVAFNSFNIRNRIDRNDKRFGEIDIDLFKSKHVKSLNTKVKEQLNIQERLIIFEAIYCAAYVKYCLDGTPIGYNIREYLKNMDLEWIMEDDNTIKNISEKFFPRFNVNFIKYIPYTISKQFDKHLIGPERTYFDKIKEIYSDLTNECVKRLNFKKMEHQSPYRLLSIFSRLWIKNHSQQKMVAESK